MTRESESARRPVPVIFLWLTAGVVAAAAELAITSPRKGEAYSVGDTIEIEWEVNGNTDTRYAGGVIIEISYDRGKRFFCVTCEHSIMPRHEEWGHYEWVVPDSIKDAATEDWWDCDPCTLIPVEPTDSAIILISNYFDPSDYICSPYLSIVSENHANLSPVVHRRDCSVAPSGKGSFPALSWPGYTGSETGTRAYRLDGKVTRHTRRNSSGFVVGVQGNSPLNR